MELEAVVVRYAGSALLEWHAHAEASVSVVLAGSIEEQVGSRTGLGRIGSVVAKPAGLEHCNRVAAEGATLLAIKGKEAAEIASRGWCWTSSHRSAIAGLQLARSLRAGFAPDAEPLIDLLSFADEAGQRPSTRRRLAWLDDIRSRLDRQNAPPVSRLAELADVHPVYLARAFRQQFDCSIRDYRRRARVRRAANLFASSDLPIAAIAASLDYFDQSHLCRDFRTELAVSPADYRAILRS
jgi:AraC family transcriptional regulator